MNSTKASQPEFAFVLKQHVLLLHIQVSYYFPHKVMWRAFFAALTAAFTLQLMNPYFSGHLVLFYANYDHQWHLFEFGPFLLIGLFGVSGGGRDMHGNRGKVG